MSPFQVEWETDADGWLTGALLIDTPEWDDVYVVSAIVRTSFGQAEDGWIEELPVVFDGTVWTVDLEWPSDVFGDADQELAFTTVSVRIEVESVYGISASNAPPLALLVDTFGDLELWSDAEARVATCDAIDVTSLPFRLYRDADGVLTDEDGSIIELAPEVVVALGGAL